MVGGSSEAGGRYSALLPETAIRMANIRRISGGFQRCRWLDRWTSQIILLEKIIAFIEIIGLVLYQTIKNNYNQLLLSFIIQKRYWPLNLKDFALFSGKCFRFSGLFPVFFPALFRNHSGKRPEKHRKKAETFFGKRSESFQFLGLII